MSEQLQEERKFLDIILKLLDEAKQISPNLVMDHNFMEVSHRMKKYKITVDLKDG